MDIFPLFRNKAVLRQFVEQTGFTFRTVFEVPDQQTITVGSNEIEDSIEEDIESNLEQDFDIPSNVNVQLTGGGPDEIIVLVMTQSRMITDEIEDLFISEIKSELAAQSSGSVKLKEYSYNS